MKEKCRQKPGFGRKLESIEPALTFRDVILLPGLAETEPGHVDIKSRVSKNCILNIPFVSSPMDTVTESEMAIALAREGGLGVLHRNCTVEEQLEMAKKVKRAEAVVIRDVVTVAPGQSVAEALELMKKHNISGLPVVDGKKLVGILTGRDVRFADLNLKVESLMTKKVITAGEDIDFEKAKEILHQHRIEKLPIVDKLWALKGLITFKDISLRGKYPSAIRDGEGQLLCAAAVSPFDLERAKKLDRHVDILVIDVAHFHNVRVFEATRKILSGVNADVVVGNLGTYGAAEDAVTKLDGVAGFRVGVGSGSICITTESMKAGAPTLHAVAKVADALADYGADLPIIADGGVKNAGDIAVALAAGASAVMSGNLFARCKEAPGTVMAVGGRYYKQYRGMGSPSAMVKRYSLDRYSQPAKGLAEGVEGWVPYKGEASTVVQELVAGLRASMGYAGAKNIHELWEKARFAMVTAAGAEETRPHDILLPSESTERMK
ncbi:MAG TPA: IMP dehydrogenase [Hadesarchaea archaeon]|nr:IMP dehydrogenase [Hadesarchaea archaeon]